jgi:pimeloyl-ACP methyl ester carboxylesterase
MDKKPMKRSHIHLTDVQGLGQLVVDATLGVTGMVEAMHHTVLGLPMPWGKGRSKPPAGVHGAIYTALQGSSAQVYRLVRRMTSVVGHGLDAAVEYFHPDRDPNHSSHARTSAVSILNGVLGDHMQAHANPLTLDMTWRKDGQAMEITRASLAAAIPHPSGKILVMLHGHCMNELQWSRNGHNHGAVLSAANGYTPMYLRYNSGLHISENGRSLADLLEQLVAQWPTPVQEIYVLGYSMGGMVARSAFHYGEKAQHGWVQHVHKLFFVGTPQHGSMVEQAGNLIDKALEASPYSHALSRLGKIRSAGTTDLRHGNLIDEDWQGHDRFAHARDRRHLSQLPVNVKCYAIAAMIAKEPSEVWGQLIGDGLVPVKSALGKHRDRNRALHLPSEHQRVFYGIGHLGLLDSQAVCDQLQAWMGA